MLITCPYCGFSKQIDPEQLPPDVSKVNCPKCKQSFPLQQPQEPVAQPEIEGTEHHSSTPETKISAQAAIDALPKAGFWLRLVAFIIDELLVSVLSLILCGLLFLAGMFSGLTNSETIEPLILLVQIFGFILSMTYYIFFTGYCGQTPGKMALRIKVIRRDGSSLSYGRAAFREIPAKFISGIIFGIGYLMVAFDDQKQGLHDRMADTYVIKL